MSLKLRSREINMLKVDFFYNNSYLLTLVSKLPLIQYWEKVKVLASELLPGCVFKAKMRTEMSVNNERGVQHKNKRWLFLECVIN